jgi:hypothetical protein
MGTPVCIDKLFVLKPFDGHNFSNWLFRLELLLEQNKVLRTISDDIPEEEVSRAAFLDQDVKARGIIVQHITDDIMAAVKNQRTAKGMMEILKKTYGMTGLGEQVRIKQELSNLKFRGESSLLSFFTKFETLVNDLKSAGGSMDNKEIITTLLSSMPSQYQSVTRTVDILFHQNPESITLDFLKNQLLSEENRITDSSKNVSNDSSAFVGYRKPRFFNRKPKYSVKDGNDRHPNVQNKTFKFRCYECNEKGHRKVDCPKLKHPKSHMAHDDACFLSSDKEALSTSENVVTFVVDSGSTHHLVDSKTGIFLENVEIVDFDVQVAKHGQTLKATRCGSLRLRLPTGNHVTIENVIECPNITRNLLSVRRIEQKGHTVIFSESSVSIEKPKGNVILNGDICGSLYVVKLGLPFNSQANVVKVNGNDNDMLLHRRMGHSSTFPCKKPCDVCLKGKQTRNSFSSIPDERKPKRILEVVSSDVCGPIETATYDGMRYFVTFLDHYSHFSHVYLLKTKDEMLNYFKDFEASVSARFGCKIDRFRCDNGGEYASKEFQNFCRERGITVEYTVPRNPQQNGCSERLNRTLCECLRCLLIDSKMPRHFWGEALRSAVYLINRRPTSALDGNVTPAEIWYGYKPDLSKIKLFGCVAYCHVDKEVRKKLDDRSSKMVMIGYANNGYRLWDPMREKVIVAKHVKFFENELYFNNQDEEAILQLGSLIYVSFDDPVDSNVERHERITRNPDELQLGQEREEERILQAPDVDIEQQDESQDGLRRSSRERKLPTWLNDYEINHVAAYSVDELLHEGPSTYEEAIEDEGWRDAVKDELECLHKNETWDLVPAPKDQQVIDSRWIFREKSVNGNIVKKARLVARGFLQGEKSCEEIFAPVARMVTIRILLSLFVVYNLFFCQLDVKCAFLNGYLSNPVYMKPPKGVETKEGVVCKLKRSLYGLKEAPKCWYTRLSDFLTSIGFKRSTSDPCLFYTENVFLVIYVDDMIILSKDKNVLSQVKSKLITTFEMRDLTNENVIEFLGISIEISNEGLKLNQTKVF